MLKTTDNLLNSLLTKQFFIACTSYWILLLMTVVTVALRLPEAVITTDFTVCPSFAGTYTVIGFLYRLSVW